MKYLKIQNNGELDIRLVALMGGTTKANDKFKIGQFGTGLKYTLAFLFRNNLDFKIFSGDKQVQITTEKELIKDTEFEIIRIEGNRTSITTQMGHQWTAWMIIRELWCNALDEGGKVRKVVDSDTDIKGEPDTTTFFLQLTPEIQQVLESWDAYFIHNKRPLWENEEYAIYPNETKGKLRLYKHGASKTTNTCLCPVRKTIQDSSVISSTCTPAFYWPAKKLKSDVEAVDHIIH